MCVQLFLEILRCSSSSSVDIICCEWACWKPKRLLLIAIVTVFFFLCGMCMDRMWYRGITIDWRRRQVYTIRYSIGEIRPRASWQCMRRSIFLRTKASRVKKTRSTKSISCHNWAQKFLFYMLLAEWPNDGRSKLRSVTRNLIIKEIFEIELPSMTATSLCKSLGGGRSTTTTK